MRWRVLLHIMEHLCATPSIGSDRIHRSFKQYQRRLTQTLRHKWYFLNLEAHDFYCLIIKYGVLT